MTATGRKGRRTAPGTPLTERMARLTAVNPDGCWLWTGAVAGKGYGVINIAGRLTKAHRVSYELHVGPIPDGLVIDHLCRTGRRFASARITWSRLPCARTRCAARGHRRRLRRQLSARSAIPTTKRTRALIVALGPVVAARTTTRTAGMPGVARLPRRRHDPRTWTGTAITSSPPTWPERPRPAR